MRPPLPTRDCSQLPHPDSRFSPPSNLPTRSPPVPAGELPTRSGLACPPPPSHPPGPEKPPPPSYPDAHGRCPAQRRDRGGNGRLLPEPAAQPCRRPRPGLRGAEPSRGREDGGREAGALRSPAPPPPPAAGENCACRPAGRRSAGSSNWGLASCLSHPRFSAPFPVSRSARLQSSPVPPPGVRGSLPSPGPGARPPPPRLPGAARPLSSPLRRNSLPRRQRLLLRARRRRRWGGGCCCCGGGGCGCCLLLLAAKSTKHSALRLQAARPPPARRPRPQLAHPPPPQQPPPPERGGGGRREEEREGGREKRGSERVLPRRAHTDPRGASASPPASPAPLPPTACPGGLRGGQLGGGAGAGGTRAAEAELALICSLPSPASASERSPTLVPGARPPALSSRSPIAVPGFGAYLPVPLSRENSLERPALAEPGSRFNPARRDSPRPVPGAWSPEIGAAGEQPLSPEIRRAEGPLTECVGASEGRGGPGTPAGGRAESQLRSCRRRGSESTDKARDGDAERRLMASPTRRAPPAPLRPPARLGAAQRRFERSPVRAALAPPPPGPPRPRLAPPPPPGGSASPLPSHRSGGCTKI
ncbi:basic proline-rich protein-like [Alexandromys fortis]|uniref:basic proline-rich protein-like n=1 Tax=Alexandromys fortis TaxID=100897 RepID=UPI0021538803|nr:basic proline-rich protein-like [Microtus fortis]